MQYWKSIWKKRSKRVDPCCQYYFSSFLFFPIIVRCSLLWKRDQRLTSFSTQWCHFRRFRQEDFTRNEKDWKWLLKMRFYPLLLSNANAFFSASCSFLAVWKAVSQSFNKSQIPDSTNLGLYGWHLWSSFASWPVSYICWIDKWNCPSVRISCGSTNSVPKKKEWTQWGALTKSYSRTSCLLMWQSIIYLEDRACLAYFKTT